VIEPETSVYFEIEAIRRCTRLENPAARHSPLQADSSS
jgi:hypothetical protein